MVGLILFLFLGAFYIGTALVGLILAAMALFYTLVSLRILIQNWLVVIIICIIWASVYWYLVIDGFIINFNFTKLILAALSFWIPAVIIWIAAGIKSRN